MTYNQQEAKKLLENRFVVIIGDSIQRGVYKDLVTLLSSDRFVKDSELKKKEKPCQSIDLNGIMADFGFTYNVQGESCHCGDKVIEQSELTNAKTYREVRQYQTSTHLVRYYFVTRIYSDYMETILLDLSKEPKPDVVIVNSCLWDMTRYGSDGDVSYKENLQMFFTRAEDMLPHQVLLIWLSGMPVSDEPKAGVLPRNLKFLGGCYPSMVRVANYYAAQVARVYERDFLDAHFHLQDRKYHRVEDGVHWNPIAHRYLSNLILKHVARAWDVEWPRNSLVDDMESLEALYAKERPYTADFNTRPLHQRSLSMPTRSEIQPLLKSHAMQASGRNRYGTTYHPYANHKRRATQSHPNRVVMMEPKPLMQPGLQFRNMRQEIPIPSPSCRPVGGASGVDMYDTYGSTLGPTQTPHVSRSFYNSGLTQFDFHANMRRGKR